MRMDAVDDRLVVDDLLVQVLGECSRVEARTAVAHKVLHRPGGARWNQRGRQIAVTIAVDHRLARCSGEFALVEVFLRDDWAAGAARFGQSVVARASRIVDASHRSIPIRVFAFGLDIGVAQRTAALERPTSTRHVPRDEGVVPAHLAAFDDFLGAHDLLHQRVPVFALELVGSSEQGMLVRKVGLSRMYVEEIGIQVLELGAPEDVFRRATGKDVVDGVVQFDQLNADADDDCDCSHDDQDNAGSDARPSGDRVCVRVSSGAPRGCLHVLRRRRSRRAHGMGAGSRRGDVGGFQGDGRFFRVSEDEAGVNRNGTTVAKHDGQVGPGEGARCHEREVGNHAHFDDLRRDEEDDDVCKGRDGDRGAGFGGDALGLGGAATEGGVVAEKLENFEVTMGQNVAIVDAEAKNQEGEDLDGDGGELEAAVEGKAHAGDEPGEDADDADQGESGVEEGATGLGGIARDGDDAERVDEDEGVGEDDQVGLGDGLVGGGSLRGAAAARAV
mmetsp:Transcript_14823/g.46629  ORF Transcript_14823/g.46629 Transcript_14823/m.46629 type:complete len:502 (+) Transcript_14823:1426-2931(+)